MSASRSVHRKQVEAQSARSNAELVFADESEARPFRARITRNSAAPAGVIVPKVSALVHRLASRCMRAQTATRGTLSPVQIDLTRRLLSSVHGMDRDTSTRMKKEMDQLPAEPQGGALPRITLEVRWVDQMGSHLDR